MKREESPQVILMQARKKAKRVLRTLNSATPQLVVGRERESKKVNIMAGGDDFREGNWESGAREEEDGERLWNREVFLKR